MREALPPQGIFVVGTDTSVGKTLVAAGLARMLRKRGHRVGVCKPFLSGDAQCLDAQILARAAGMAGPGLLQPALLDVISPFRFAAPLAPGVAARREGRTVKLEDAVEHVRQLGAVNDILIVEGAGGVLVPLTADLLPGGRVIDLIAALGLPALVVGRTALGTINHSALTVMALRAAHIPVAGMVLSRVDAAHEEADAAVLDAIEGLSGIRPFCCIPHVRGSEAIRVGTVARLLEQREIWDRLLDRSQLT
jgi:dethiobiotin synthetase